MAADRLVPFSLQRRLGNETEIAIFEEWQRKDSSPVHQILPDPGNSHFESQRAVFVQPQPYHDLEQYVAVCVKNDNPMPGTDFRKCTWEDALHQAEAAEREYNRRDVNSPVRSWMRTKGSSLATDLAPLKDLFPEDHGLNVIAGGLSLIFHGLSKIADNRDRMFLFFKRIRTLISEAQKTHKSLPQDVALDDSLDELRQAVVNALCGLLRILQPREKKSLLSKVGLSAKASPKIDSIFQADSTAEKIDGFVKEVEQCRKNFDECAQTGRTKMLRDAHSNSEKSLREAKATRQTVHTVGQKVDSLGEQFELYSAKFDRIERQQAQTAFYVIFQDGMRSQVMVLNSSSESTMLIQERNPAMTLDELLENLDVDPESPGNDLLGSAEPTMFPEDSIQQLISGILKDDSFQRWLFGAQSAGLLLDANATTTDTGVDSPFGIFSSMFMTSLRMLTRQGHKPRFASCFLCNLHSDPSEPLSGPSGMMRSLIAQLVYSVFATTASHNMELDRFDLSFLHDNPYLSYSLTNYEVGGLCEVYINMIRQLSSNATVVCLINEVDHFETDDNNWRAEICFVVQRLQQLARFHDNGPAFKLCLTTSSGTTDVDRYFAGDECISPALDLFSLPVSTEDAFMDELEDADTVVSSAQAGMRALDIDSGAHSSGYLHPSDRTPQRISRSRGSSPGPSFSVIPFLQPSRSTPDMRSAGQAPGNLPVFER